jgi:hypothetical protein
VLALTAAASGTPLLKDASDAPAVPMGQTLTGNALDNASVPPGTTATVTGFIMEGSFKVYTPGSGPVALNDPDTGLPMGTLTLQPNGAYIFVPEPGYVGSAPAVSLYVKSSDGQTAVSALTIDVVLREYPPPKQKKVTARMTAQHVGQATRRPGHT